MGQVALTVLRDPFRARGPTCHPVERQPERAEVERGDGPDQLHDPHRLAVAADANVGHDRCCAQHRRDQRDPSQGLQPGRGHRFSSGPVGSEPRAGRVRRGRARTSHRVGQVLDHDVVVSLHGFAVDVDDAGQAMALVEAVTGEHAEKGLPDHVGADRSQLLSPGGRGGCV